MKTTSFLLLWMERNTVTEKPPLRTAGSWPFFSSSISVLTAISSIITSVVSVDMWSTISRRRYLITDLYGKVFADKGYISPRLFDCLSVWWRHTTRSWNQNEHEEQVHLYTEFTYILKWAGKFFRLLFQFINSMARCKAAWMSLHMFFSPMTSAKPDFWRVERTCSFTPDRITCIFSFVDRR